MISRNEVKEKSRLLYLHMGIFMDWIWNGKGVLEILIELFG